jgi:hypothetical protein
VTQKKKTMDSKPPQATANHLFEFEKFSFDEGTSNPKATDEELNSRYAKGETRIVTEQARYPLAGILEMLKEEVAGDAGENERRYKLDPEYQRRHRWSDKRKSRLIESFLMNVPVPPVFLYERDLARFEVMDGRQRLTALSEFYDDVFALTGLQHWKDLDGRKYSQLPSKVRDGIDRRYISSVILLKETASNEKDAARLKKIVFERLNSGGVKLANQETRNAVYNGPLNQLCLELSANRNFRRMWRIPPNPKHEEKDLDEEEDDKASKKSTMAGNNLYEKMEDVELVLRFFAYRKIDEFKAGLNKISDFLDRFLALGNKFSEEDLKIYKSMFEKTIDFLWNVLGTEAFTVLKPTNKRPTKFVYDPLMFVASSPEVAPKYDSLIKNKDALRKELQAMYEKNQLLFSGRHTNFKDTKDRNRCMSESFSAVIAKV